MLRTGRKTAGLFEPSRLKAAGGPGDDVRIGAADVRDLIRLLESDGWKHVRTTGSHRHFKHPTKPNGFTVPGNPGHDIPTGTIKAILKSAALEEKG